MTAFDTLPTGVAGVGYDRSALATGIVHLGLGGFARAHLARYTHDLMEADADARRWGVTGVGLREENGPLIAALAAQDGLYTLTERDDAGARSTVIGSLAGVIDASADTAPVLDAIDRDAVGIVSLTVTEHGYCLDRATRTLDLKHPLIVHDLATPEKPRSAIGVIVAAYARRRRRNAAAFTALSCDNIQHNGDVLRGAVLSLAEASDPGLARWIAEAATFPNAMVDRITPVPTEADMRDFRRRTGIADAAPLLAEPFRQWVIEDRFVAGRPAWEKVGAQFVDDVTPYEFMKLRLLNTSHLVVAGLGQLAGHERIDEALADPLIRRVMIALMERETGPTLLPVPGVDLAAYKAALVARFANPAIRDTTERVNTDAPLNYLLDPLRDRLAARESIDLLALGLAAWLRRLRGTDDAGRPLTIRHPMADALRARAIEGGADPRPLLGMTALFGDLGGDRRLVARVGNWLGQLYDKGVAGTLGKAAADKLI